MTMIIEKRERRTRNIDLKTMLTLIYFLNWTFELAQWQKTTTKNEIMISLHFVSFFLFVHPSIFTLYLRLKATGRNIYIYIYIYIECVCVCLLSFIYTSECECIYLFLFFLSFREKKKRKERKEVYMNAS